jgi:hypothetical protein
MNRRYDDPETVFMQRADPDAVMLAMSQMSNKVRSDSTKAKAFVKALEVAVNLGMANRNARIGVCEVKTAFKLK